ncbi:PREDICTED: protein SRG1 [Tarenaya hassleriana]|uniref:protein SRG1 n=1 Tax=Tarenaya hassleriana TaxID=28532 RepID=UPI00053C3289|nr:PREDICTED: protein SRG1 [Tarenaya hassleriana]
MEKPKFKTVQEVIVGGEGLPERYLHKPTADGEPLNASVPEMDIPAIDLSLLSSSTEELSKLRSSLSTWGVVQVMNHGMTEEFLDKVRGVTEQFFALPTEEKQKYARETGSIEGYGSDMILSDDQVLDWIDRLYLTTHPEDQRQLKFWPEIPVGFRETLHGYTMKQQEFVEEFLKAMARSLELDENCFLEMYGEKAMLFTRFNLYPPCPRPDNILGLKPHADGSAITLLLPDKQVQSLQFLKDGKWYKAPTIPDTILINVGDQIEIMSNGIYKSPVHRVVTNMEKERVISVATFCVPGPDKEIQPAEGLVTETRPRLYKTVKKYVETYFDYYQQGRRPIEAAII